MNLDDVYDVQPPDLEDEYDIDGGPLEQEFEMEPDIEQEFDLGSVADDSQDGRYDNADLPPLTKRLFNNQYEKWQAYEDKPWTEVLPQMGGVLLGAAVPASIPAQVIGGLLINAGVRGTSAALEGKPVLEAVDPLNDPLQTAADVMIPVGVGAFTRGSRAPRLDETLPDFQRATSANAELPPVDDITTFREVTTENVPRASTEPTTVFGRIRQATMNPTRWLQRSEDVAASAAPGYEKSTRRIAGDTLDGYRMMRNQVVEQGRHELNDIFRGLSDEEATLVGRVMNGDAPIESVPEHVAEAARRSWAWREQIGTRAEGIEGMQTRNPETGEVYHFARLGEPSFPRIPDRTQMVDTVRFESRANRTNRVNPTQTSRVGDSEHAPPIIMNARTALNQYLDNFAEDMAASHYFGSRAGGSVWGERADRIHEMLVAEGDGRAAKAFASRMDKTMNPPKTDADAWIANAIAQKTAQVALPLSPMTSWAQVGSNVARNGLSNTVEGITRWLRDPSVRRLAESSGAMTADVAGMAENAGVGPRNIARRWMASTERGLRGFLNSGTVPYVENVLQRVQAGARDRTTLRQLRELGIELADAENGVTADNLRRAWQKSSDTLQLQAHDPMNAGVFFDSPQAKAAFQFMQYPAEATRLAHDMVVDPVVQGVRNMDASEAALGIGRAARWVPATVAAAGAAEVARAGLQGRKPDPKNAVLNAADSIGGLPVSMATTVVRGFDPIKGFGQMPGVGIASQSFQSASRFKKQPQRSAVELASDIAAAADPTGTAALARQLVRGRLKEAYKQ